MTTLESPRETDEQQVERHTLKLIETRRCSLTLEECAAEIVSLRARQSTIEAEVNFMGDDWLGQEHDFLSNMIGEIQAKAERLEDEKPRRPARRRSII